MDISYILYKCTIMEKTKEIKAYLSLQKKLVLLKYVNAKKGFLEVN